MRGFKLALVLGAAVVLASPALAQRGRGGMFGGNFFANPSFLIRAEKVQKDLGLDKDKAAKVEAALTKAREENQDEFGKLRDASPEERAEIMKKINAANDKAINSVLDEKQQKRLHQIVLQQQGIGALQQEDVQKALKLSDEQKEKIKDIQGDLQKEMQGLFQPGEKPDFQAMQKKMEGLRKEAMTNATKVLNDDQKKTFKDLTGEPLELKPEDFPQGFGRGGRGGKPDKPRTDF